MMLATYATDEEEVVNEEVTIRVQLARIEQRLTDHEVHDEHFRKMAMWVGGFVITILVGVIGTMWLNLIRVDASQQVLLATTTEIRQQLVEIRDNQKIMQDTLVKHQLDSKDK